MESPYVGPSQHREAWRAATFGQLDSLLESLAEDDSPGAAMFELATYINGRYRATQHPLANVTGTTVEAVTPDVVRVLPAIRQIRRRLGWQQRELDLGLLRWIRRASALSAVVGAGVTMATGGPSWAELVRLLLEVALNTGHEIAEMAPSPTNTADQKEFRRQVVRVERFSAHDEAAARGILDQIAAQQADTETLMRGAQLCYDLFGQHLFTHVTQIIYSRAPKPGEVHRAIAELAHGQHVPDRGPQTFPGWDSLITYNFDALLSEALAEQQVPHVAWAMRGNEIAGDPDALARQGDWHQSIYHLHGYTPRRLFLITQVEFVFSTAQYLRVYKERRAIIDKALNDYLANPVHVALYTGCSFADEAMNDLLRQAAQRFPGRMHYALLKWPEARQGREPSGEEMETHATRYLEMGVQPIWVDDYAEIPDLIRRLK